MKADSTLFSIGHGQKSKEVFLSELKSFSIQFVVDVRTIPFSKWAEQFNRGFIEGWLRAANIRYVYMGDVIGGRPKNPSYYDREGQADYKMLAQDLNFRMGLNRLVDANRKGCRVVIMCSESDPAECHRSKLIGRELFFSHNISVKHIVDVNKTISQEEIMEKLTRGGWLRKGNSLLEQLPPPYFKSRKTNKAV